MEFGKIGQTMLKLLIQLKFLRYFLLQRSLQTQNSEQECSSRLRAYNFLKSFHTNPKPLIEKDLRSLLPPRTVTFGALAGPTDNLR